MWASLRCVIRYIPDRLWSDSYVSGHTFKLDHRTTKASHTDPVNHAWQDIEHHMAVLYGHKRRPYRCKTLAHSSGTGTPVVPTMVLVVAFDDTRCVTLAL